MYMIQDAGFVVDLHKPDQLYWGTALNSPYHMENHLEECRKIMHLITMAIDAQCRQRRDREKAFEEIRRLFGVYVTLSSFARQAEMEQIQILMDEDSRPASPMFISVPHYEDEPIWCK